MLEGGEGWRDKGKGEEEGEERELLFKKPRVAVLQDEEKPVAGW